MKNVIITLTGILIIIFLFNSCASVSSVAKKITIESGEVPPDMKSEEFIIIGVLKGRRSYDKYVKKEFSKYTGNYILAQKDEITEKYSDVNKYRYIMDYTKESSTSTKYNPNYKQHGSQPFEDNTTTGYRYFIQDRKENKEYTRKSRSSNFKLEMRAYITALESIRIK
ncbi:MAG: hypothetical protein HPY60_11450 [Candidatus Methanofastidiosum sp.]|nr:hypothetical protein [Methanofastidiosum sp.]